MTQNKKSNPPEKTATADAVAGWMLKELEKQDGVLHQDDAVSNIADLFGERFVYENDLGNACIAKQVLAAFRKLTGDSVVWSRGERLWRLRESGDELTRQQN
jgi:hypothetical protein